MMLSASFSASGFGALVAEGKARFVAVSPDHFFAHGAKEGDIPFFGM